MQTSRDIKEDYPSAKAKGIPVHSQSLRHTNPSFSSPSRSEKSSWLEYQPSGRLGDPHMELYKDPGVHLLLLRVMADYGLDRDQRSHTRTSMMCILINYRNPRDTQSGFNPFPAASNYVCTAIHYIHSRRDYLDLLNIVLQGDGFGSNLALSAAIRARRENWLNKIDGVYACYLFISNGVFWSEEVKLRDLPSFIECSGYGTSAEYIAYMAHIYTPRIEDHSNLLA